MSPKRFQEGDYISRLQSNPQTWKWTEQPRLGEEGSEDAMTSQVCGHHVSSGSTEHSLSSDSAQRTICDGTKIRKITPTC